MHVYSLSIVGASVAVAVDVFEFVAPVDARVAIREIAIAQTASVDEVLGIEIWRGHTTGGSGGSAVTPVKFNPYLREALTTATRTNTTQASGGSPEALYSDAWNTRAGWYWRAKNYAVQDNVSEFGMGFRPGQRGVVRLSAAPSGALTMNATLVFEELAQAPV